jgi:hypothetical protein
MNVTLLLVFTAIGMSTAQSNDFLDALLAEERAGYGNTVHLTLMAVNLVREDSGTRSALGVLAEQGWGIEVREYEEPIRLGEFAYLLMKAFDLSGGLMYRLFPGPRYAVRELFYLELMHGSANPFRFVTGEEVVRVVGGILRWREERL